MFMRRQHTALHYYIAFHFWVIIQWILFGCDHNCNKWPMQTKLVKDALILQTKKTWQEATNLIISLLRIRYNVIQWIDSELCHQLLLFWKPLSLAVFYVAIIIITIVNTNGQQIKWTTILYATRSMCSVQMYTVSLLLTIIIFNANGDNFSRSFAFGFDLFAIVLTLSLLNVVHWTRNINLTMPWFETNVCSIFNFE